MRDTGVSSEHRSGRKCLSEHFTGGLEARPNHQFCRLRVAVSVFGEFSLISVLELS